LNSTLIFFLFFLSPEECYLNKQKFEEAARYYQLASAIDPTHESSFGTAIGCLKVYEIDNCIKLLESIPDKGTEVFYYLAVANFRIENYDRASTYFNLFIKENKSHWQSNYYLGLIELKNNRIENIFRQLSTIPDTNIKIQLESFINNYTVLVNARGKLEIGEYDKAIDLYTTIEGLFGYKEMGLALVYFKKQDFKRSLILLDTIITSNGESKLVNQALIKATEACLASRDYKKAKSYITKYTATKSFDHVKYLLGKILSFEAKYDSAAYYFKGLPDSIDEYLFYKGRTDYFLGSWGRAEEKLLRHRESFRNSLYGDKATYILASINYKRKEYDQAIDFWNELLVIFPTSIYAAASSKGIGDSYFNLKMYRNALKTYRKVDNYKPSKTLKEQITLKIYETSYHLKKYSSLTNALRKFIDENPNSKLVPKVRLRIVRILSNKKDFYLSISELNKLIESKPELAILSEAYLERARIFQKIGNEREVKKSFQYLLTDKNERDYYSYAANELATIYLIESKYDSALFYYNLLLDYDKYREKAIFEIAKSYDILGQSKESETMINKLISEFPASVFLLDAYILKSKIYKNQGKHEKARNILQDLIEKVGQKPEIYIEIGNIYFEIEDYVNARDNYLIACENFKQRRDEATKALILAGNASLAIGDIKEAREYYMQASLIAESISLKNQVSAKIRAISED
jgi:tetratricopeptide (TPR) repeat protein